MQIHEIEKGIFVHYKPFLKKNMEIISFINFELFKVRICVFYVHPHSMARLSFYFEKYF